MTFPLARRHFWKLATVALPWYKQAAAATLIPDSFPLHPPEMVHEMVTVAHGSFKRVKELVEARPALAKAAIDWGFGDWEFYPLDELVDYHQGMWMDTQEEAADDADEPSPWAATWFPVLRGSGWADLLIDCGEHPTVALVRGTAPFEPGRPRMSSLSAVLEAWLTFFKDGYIRWDNSSQNWTRDVDFATYKAALGD